MANPTMTMPEQAPMPQGISLAPQTLHLQPNQQITISPSVPSTIYIFPGRYPVSSPLDGPQSENQPSSPSTQRLALENSSRTQGFATRTSSSAPKEQEVWRKFQQYIPPSDFEGDWRFKTLHGRPVSVTIRVLYDTGCDVNLIPETTVYELGYRDKIRKLETFDLVSLAGTKIECVGEVGLPWTDRKKWFRSQTEMVPFLVVPSSNTAITSPIIGADTLKTYGLLQTNRREGRAFGAARRKFSSNSKEVSEEVAANRLIYAQRKAENQRQLKEETERRDTPQPMENHMSQQTKNLLPQQNFR